MYTNEYDPEQHWTEDDAVWSEGTARVFGYSSHKMKSLRNIQISAIVGKECEYCVDGTVVGYAKCYCCNESVWICNDCAKYCK